MAAVVFTGPLFERGDLAARMVLANIKASNEAGPIMAQALSTAYSGGIVHRGPGRYGHLAESIQWRTQVAGDAVATRAMPAGKGAFKAVFLERGTRGPHRGGLSGILLPDERRDQRAKAAGHAAALTIGPLFRRSAQPHGAPAFRVVARVAEETAPKVKPIFERALARELGAA